MSMGSQGMRKSRVLAGGMLAAALAAGCAAGGSQPVFKRVGPLITLRVGVYGSPGYQQARLYAEYERLQPSIKIVEDDTPQQASYWTALRSGLESGRALDDIQAVPVADIAVGDRAAVRRLRAAPSSTRSLTHTAGNRHTPASSHPALP
jgi:cellobiose transport system substrate-binding protein